MSEQIVQLGFRTNTAPIVSATRETQQLGAAVNGVRGNFSGLGMAVLYASQTFEDLQYGTRAVLNNIPILAMAMGAGPGVAGVLSLAAVAASQLVERFGGVQDVVKATASEVENLTAQIKTMNGSMQSRALQGVVDDIQAGLSAIKQVGSQTGRDATLAANVSSALQTIVPSNVIEQLMLIQGDRINQNNPEIAKQIERLESIRGQRGEKNVPLEAAIPGQAGRVMDEISKLEAAGFDTARGRIGQIVGRAQSGDAKATADLIAMLEAGGFAEAARMLRLAQAGQTVKGQSAAIAENMDAARAAVLKGRSLDIQESMDGALQAVLEGRRKEAQQLQERLRWEQIRFNAEQNAAERKKQAQEAELARMDPRPFIDRAIDNMMGGGLNPFLVAQSGRMLAQQGFNEAGIRARQVQMLGSDIFQAGLMGQGPILTRMEANAQARRLLDQAAPEAGFMAQQQARANQLTPRVVDALMRNAAAVEQANQRGVPMVLRNGARR